MIPAHIMKALVGDCQPALRLASSVHLAAGQAVHGACQNGLAALDAHGRILCLESCTIPRSAGLDATAATRKHSHGSQVQFTPGWQSAWTGPVGYLHPARRLTRHAKHFRTEHIPRAQSSRKGAAGCAVSGEA